MTLVDRSEIRKDPRKLPFLYPKMPAARYKELSEEYHRKITLIAVENVAGMFVSILLPASCVHHSRRRPERRLTLHGRTYYVFDRDDVTDLEWAKYEAIAKGGKGND